MKKTLLPFIFALCSINTKAQIIVQNKECTTEFAKPYAPAPCSINGNSEKIQLYLIQIGAYQNPITPKSGTIVLESSVIDQATGSIHLLYRYYIAAIFPFKEEAENYLIKNKLTEVYCDAIIVPFPFQNMYGFF